MSDSNLISTSTTDTPEQVRAAMEAHGYSPEPSEAPQGTGAEGPPKKTSGSPAPAEPPATPDEAAGTTAAAPGATETNQETDKGDPGKKKKGLQDRIDELTRARREAERKTDELQRKLDEANAGKREPEKPETAKPDVIAATEDPEPLLDAFEDYEGWTKAHQKWTARQENAPLRAEIESLKGKLEARERNEDAQRARQPLVDAWVEKVDKAKVAHPDYDEATARSAEEGLTATPAMHQEIFESDQGAEVVYFLATHPEECRRIAELTAVAEKPTPDQIGRALRIAAREIARIEDRISTESGNPPAKEPAKPPENKSAKPNPLPAPLTPVKGAAAGEKDPGKMSTEEYFRWEQSRKKSRAA